MNLTWNPNGTEPRTTHDPYSVFHWDDASWVMSACFIIFGMQTGFGMLESGCVSLKNEVNIMMKNVVDVVLGKYYPGLARSASVLYLKRVGRRR